MASNACSRGVRASRGISVLLLLAASVAQPAYGQLSAAWDIVAVNKEAAMKITRGGAASAGGGAGGANPEAMFKGKHFEGEGTLVGAEATEQSQNWHAYLPHPQNSSNFTTRATRVKRCGCTGTCSTHSSRIANAREMA